MQGPKKIGELLLRPVEHILREQSAPRSELKQNDVLRRSKHARHLIKLARQQTSKDGVHVARRVKISSLAELRGVARVVTKFRIVEAQLHVAREGNRSAFTDF